MLKIFGMKQVVFCKRIVVFNETFAPVGVLSKQREINRQMLRTNPVIP